MADPMTMALVGAGTGALMNKKDPLMGAALGGLGGYFLGPMAGKAFGAGEAAAGQLASSIPYGSEQAAMLSAQTAEFGPQGLAMTRAAANPAMQQSGLLGGMKNFMGEKPLGGPFTRGDMFKAGMSMNQPQQPQNQVASVPRPVSQPMPNAIQSASMFNGVNPAMGQNGMPVAQWFNNNKFYPYG